MFKLQNSLVHLIDESMLPIYASNFFYFMFYVLKDIQFTFFYLNLIIYHFKCLLNLNKCFLAMYDVCYHGWLPAICGKSQILPDEVEDLSFL